MRFRTSDTLLHPRYTVILSGVWRVLCDKRSRRSCGCFSLELDFPVWTGRRYPLVEFLESHVSKKRDMGDPALSVVHSLVPCSCIEEQIWCNIMLGNPSKGWFVGEVTLKNLPVATHDAYLKLGK